MGKTVFIAAGVALAVFAWIASGQMKGQETEAAPEIAAAVEEEPKAKPLSQVRVRRSVARDHQSKLVLFGRTEGVRSVEVRVETSGRIVSVPVKKGRKVKKGEVIARIDMADRKARLKEAEALVERFRVAYEAANKLSKKQFRSKVQLAEARANLETAKAGLQAIRLDIDRTTVRAPFNGVLNSLPVDVGDYVAVGQVTATVVDLNPILAVGDVTERAASRLRVGDKATVTVTGGEPLEGVVRYISKAGSTTTRTFRAEISLDNPGGAIAEGMTAELRLVLGSIKAHFLSPAILTLNDKGEIGVKAVDEDDRVHFHKVKIIDDTPEGMWLTGIPDDVRLIIVGQEFVRAGQKVESSESGQGQAS